MRHINACECVWALLFAVYTSGDVMFRIQSGRTPRYCDGLSRRSFLQVGMAGLGTLGLPSLLQAREAAAAAGGERKQTSVILIWLDGGPSHHDT